jgi:hypothetical protein
MTTQQTLVVPGWQALVAAGQVDPFDPAATSATTAALAAVETAMRHDTAVAIGTVRGRRRRRVILALAACAAVAAVAAVALAAPTIGIGGNPPAATATAATFLTEVATAQAAQPAPAAGYLRIDTEEFHAGAGASRLTVWYGRGDVAVAQNGGPVHHKTVTMTFGFADPRIDPAGLDALAGDPATVKARLYASTTDGDRDGQVFRTIGELLTRSPVRPATRAVLYQIAAEIPGVRLVGDSTDSRGRRGTAVARTGADVSTRFVIDPASAAMLETTETSTIDIPADPQCTGEPKCQPAVRAGDLVQRTTYLAATSTDTTG